MGKIRSHSGPGSFYLPYILLIACSFFSLCASYHMNLCVGSVPRQKAEAAGNTDSIGSISQQYHRDPISNGAYAGAVCFDKPESMANSWDMYYFKYKSSDIEDPDNILFGWLHVKIKAPSGLDTVVLQSWVPKNDVQYVPGEMVTTSFGGDCKESFDGVNMSKANLSPCYMVPDPSPTVPVAIVGIGGFKEIAFNYRLDFPECAMVWERQSLEFRFYGNRGGRPICNPQKDQPKLIASPQNRIYFRDSTYGSYDPEPPRGSITTTSCSDQVVVGKPSWITGFSESVWVDVVQDGIQSNAPDFRNSPCHQPAIDTHSAFAGRCSNWGNSGWKVGATSKHQCPDIYGTRHRNGSVELVPEFPPGAGACQGCEAARNTTREKGISANSLIGKIIWGLRTTHGMAMAWTTMFVMPFATILSRYYKETFMDQRYVNVHIWHGLHISASLTGFAGLISGVVAAVFGRMYFGFSRHPMGYVHWMMGYLSILAFVVALCSSPFRIFTRSKRILVIFFHFLLGSVSRVLWALCLLTSFYIPGSPSSLKDIHIHGFTIEFPAFIVIGWIVVDVGIHVLLMMHLLATDRHVKFPKRRTYAIAVPIPLLRPYADKDLHGKGLRRLLLILHTVIGFVCATILAVFICWNTPVGRYFGRMRYTHKDSGKLNMLMRESLYDE